MIYVIPSPLVDKEEINLKQKTRGFVEVNAPHFWYLHGALQEKFHYDGAYMFVDYGTSKTETVQIIDGHLYLAPGIHNVVIEGYDNPCKAYMWHRQEGPYTLMRGIVVDPSIKDDLEYAEKLYSEKPVAF